MDKQEIKEIVKDILDASLSIILDKVMERIEQEDKKILEIKVGRRYKTRGGCQAIVTIYNIDSIDTSFEIGGYISINNILSPKAWTRYGRYYHDEESSYDLVEEMA